MFRSVVVIIWTVLSTIPFAWGAVLASIFSPSGKGCHTVARMWARLILWVSGVKVHVQGLERLDHDRHYIFMSNHQSMFDIPVKSSGWQNPQTNKRPQAHICTATENRPISALFFEISFIMSQRAMQHIYRQTVAL